MTTRCTEELTPTGDDHLARFNALDVQRTPAGAGLGEHSVRREASLTPPPPRGHGDAEASTDLHLRKQGRGRDAMAIADLTMALRDATRAGLELARAEVQLARARARLELCVRAASRK
jgi:hypothetical protein